MNVTARETKSRRIYILTSRFRADNLNASENASNVKKTEHRVIITSYEDHGSFWYVGYSYVNQNEGKWGYCRLYKNPVNRGVFGTTLERTSEFLPKPTPWKPFTPQPGDRAYDLMH